jgi:hypothetical protein
MRRMVCCLFVLAALSAGCATQSKVTDDHLVFLGTVEKLDTSPLPQSTLNWVVQCRVDKIVTGQFSGKTFSFRIHSPARSGLEVGKQYKIVAKRTAEGFAVDQYQWMK